MPGEIDVVDMPAARQAYAALLQVGWALNDHAAQVDAIGPARSTLMIIWPGCRSALEVLRSRFPAESPAFTQFGFECVAIDDGDIVHAIGDLSNLGIDFSVIPVTVESDMRSQIGITPSGTK